MICIALRKTSAAGLIGPYEADLMDRHTLHDPAQSLEIQCTVHSFDPCSACAVHVTDAEGTERALIKVH
jgi:hydrogenase large subunit